MIVNGTLMTLIWLIFTDLICGHLFDPCYPCSIHTFSK